MDCPHPGQALTAAGWEGAGRACPCPVPGCGVSGSQVLYVGGNDPAGASVSPQYSGDGSGSWSHPNKRASIGSDAGVWHAGVWHAGGLPAQLPPQVHSCPAIAHGSALQIAFHPVNPAGIALWPHSAPHKGDGAQLLGLKGHLLSLGKGSENLPLPTVTSVVAQNRTDRPGPHCLAGQVTQVTQAAEDGLGGV